MIKPNELRVGNYILFDTGFACIPPMHRMKEEDIIHLYQNADSVNHAQPIELTPEILEKAGFKKEIIPYGSHIRPIKHLHELQNLFFAIFNKELEINL